MCVLCSVCVFRYSNCIFSSKKRMLSSIKSPIETSHSCGVGSVWDDWETFNNDPCVKNFENAKLPKSCYKKWFKSIDLTGKAFSRNYSFIFHHEGHNQQFTLRKKDSVQILVIWFFAFCIKIQTLPRIDFISVTFVDFESEFSL